MTQRGPKSSCSTAKGFVDKAMRPVLGGRVGFWFGSLIPAPAGRSIIGVLLREDLDGDGYRSSSDDSMAFLIFIGQSVSHCAVSSRGPMPAIVLSCSTKYCASRSAISCLSGGGGGSDFSLGSDFFFFFLFLLFSDFSLVVR